MPAADPILVAQELSLDAARTLCETVRTLALDHPVNRRFGYVKTVDTWEGPVIVVGPDWSEPPPSEDDVTELRAAGCVLTLGEGAFVPTPLGRSVAAVLSQQGSWAPEVRSTLSALDWSSLLEPHLRSIYDTWVAAGAPPTGVAVGATSLGALDGGTARGVLRDLELRGFVTLLGPVLAQAQPDLAAELVSPSAQARALFSVWPQTPDEAWRALLAALRATLAEGELPPGEQATLEAITDLVTRLAPGTLWAVIAPRPPAGAVAGGAASPQRRGAPRR